MGTFGSFTTVRLGLYAAQKGLDVTGNNITNINTEGYTRQRLNQVSLIPSVNDRYASSYNPRIGQGAVIAGINQIRDPGLDISYRKAASDVGSANTKLEGLNNLATILDEVGKGDLEQDDGVILSQLNDLRDLISQAIVGGVDTYDPLIRSSAEALTTLFHSYADKLSELQETYEDNLEQQVSEVNDILNNIRDLNLAIRNSDIRGDPGLELRDQRNRLLDEQGAYISRITEAEEKVKAAQAEVARQKRIGLEMQEEVESRDERIRELQQSQTVVAGTADPEEIERRAQEIAQAKIAESDAKWTEITENQGRQLRELRANSGASQAVKTAAASVRTILEGLFQALSLEEDDVAGQAALEDLEDLLFDWSDSIHDMLHPEDTCGYPSDEEEGDTDDET